MSFRALAHRRRFGFTLIELMIAVAIVAILATIAIPAYTAYVRRANRSDAKTGLLNDVQILERCYTQIYAYTPCPALPPTPQGYYTLTSAAPTATSYTLTMTPVSSGPQAADSLCTSFSIDNLGNRTATGSGSDANTYCWNR